VVGKLCFFGGISNLLNEHPAFRCLYRAKGSEWVVYAKRPFAEPHQVLDYVVVTPIVSPSPITACLISTTTRCDGGNCK
jgi:hypothetical protein